MVSASDCHGVMVTTESDFHWPLDNGGQLGLSALVRSPLWPRTKGVSQPILVVTAVTRGLINMQSVQSGVIMVTMTSPGYRCQWPAWCHCTPGHSGRGVEAGGLSLARASDWLVSVSVYSGWMGWTDNPSHYRPHSKIRSPELRDTSPDILTVSPRPLRLQLATAGADTEEHLGHLSSSPNGHPPSSTHTSLSNLPIFFSFLLLVSCWLQVAMATEWRSSYRVQECWQCLLSIFTKHNDPGWTRLLTWSEEINLHFSHSPCDCAADGLQNDHSVAMSAGKF